MNTLNKFHREILISDLSDLIDKKEGLEQFGLKMIKEKIEATTQQRIDAAQANIDINRLEINFIQDQIERIKEILVNNQI
jgi:hypothetical protein